jgi:HEAT repeat protein
LYIRWRDVKKLLQLGHGEQLQANLFISLLKGYNWFREKETGSKTGKTGKIEYVEIPLDLSIIMEETLFLRGKKVGVAPLISLLKDQEKWTRRFTAKALGDIGSAESLSYLIQLLKDKDSETRNNAKLALRQLGNSEGFLYTLPKLTEKFEDLKEGYEQKYLTSTLNTNIKDKLPKIVEKVGKLPLTKESLQWLIHLIEEGANYRDEERAIKRQAIKSLGQISPLQAEQRIQLFLDLLKDNNSDVKVQPIKSIGKTGIQTNIIKDNDIDIKAQAIDIKTQAKDNNSDAKVQAIKSIGKTGIQTNIIKDNNIDIKTQAIESLGKIGKFQANRVISALLPLSTTEHFKIRQAVTKALGEIGSGASKENRDKLLETLTNLANNPQELFSIRIEAIEALGKVGTPTAATHIINIATQENGTDKEAYRFAAYQALQHTRSPKALAFLQQELKQLDKQKQQWREQRDSDTGSSETPSVPKEKDCTPATIVENEKRWRYGAWETELGYAIAQLEPNNAGIQLLEHPLANVRKGAWFGISKKGVPTVALIKRIHEQREKSQESYFRHAAFRAIDKSLITIEVFGKKADLAALQAWKVKDIAVRDRIEFTVAELGYRLEQGTTD